MQLSYPEKYYEKVKERFPDLTYREIDTIIKFGLRSMFINCGYGGDILLKAPYFTMYIGKFFKDKLMYTKYKILKESIKLRIKYKRSKTQWDGYYYFGLSEEEFQDYLSNFKNTGMGNSSKGRRRKKIIFKKIKCYKLLDECKLHTINKHIFKIKFPEDFGFSFWKENYATYNAQYILRRKDKEWEHIEYEINRYGNKYVKHSYINKQKQ